MEQILQQLLNGISLGAIYALIALGYTMVYGVLRFINFAHADVFMVGAFLAFFLGQNLPANSIASTILVLLAAMTGCALLGTLIERLAYRPLRSAPTLNVLITAIGVSLLLEYSGQLFLGANPRTFPPVYPSAQLTLGGVILSGNQLLVIGVTAALVLLLQLVIYQTKIGAAMRAVSLNPDAARLVGINVNAVIAFTFALGSALAGAGGVLYAINYPSIDPLMGLMPGLKAFVCAILGGIGNIPGAALGGLILGLVETFVGGSEASTWKDAVAFGLLILILLFRPAGLLGKPLPEKV